MQEIRCPKCSEVFQVDEAGYAAIVKQVRDREFMNEIQQREQQYQQQLKAAVALARADVQKNKDDVLAAKEKELADKVLEISRLQNQLQQKETEKALALQTAAADYQRQLAAKDSEVVRLSGVLKNSDNEYALKEQSLKEGYKAQLAAKDSEIEFYRDFKARQSTKMVGESLEQHCLIQFNSMRSVGFQTAYFDKDNDARSGSKGDFIFRDFTSSGQEYISIMFEMKNETETQGKKHKNEDFFKELDKDRNEKQCEYAVLVSLLEPDNEFYNNGIVDVSYLSGYPKMYVIRPQFFIPLITILRNTAMNSLGYKQELERIRSQELDITNFESKLGDFVQMIGKNYDQVYKKSNSIIDEIDEAIKQLNKVKENFTGIMRNLRVASEKADGMTIRKLTYKNPTMQAKFKELQENEE